MAITNGDTVKVLYDNQTIKVQLASIDASEMDHPSGKHSKQFVSKLIFGKTVGVKDLGPDKYKRTLAYITQEHTPVNEAIVAASLAWHYVKYSKDPKIANAKFRVRIARGARVPTASLCHPGTGAGSLKLKRRVRKVSSLLFAQSRFHIRRSTSIGDGLLAKHQE